MPLQTDVTQAMQLLPEVNGVFVLVQHESNVTPVAAEILQPGYAWVTLAEDPDFAELLRVELRWMQISPAKPPVPAPAPLFGPLKSGDIHMQEPPTIVEYRGRLQPYQHCPASSKLTCCSLPSQLSCCVTAIDPENKNWN
jgi:hypothetical protein